MKNNKIKKLKKQIERLEIILDYYSENPELFTIKNEKYVNELAISLKNEALQANDEESMSYCFYLEVKYRDGI